MIKLTNIIKELQIQNPNLPDIPEGWNEELDDLGEDEDGKVIRSFWAPMEGWDDNHQDIVKILKLNDGTYKLQVYISFADWLGNEGPFNTYREALMEAIDVMEGLKEEWDEEGDEFGI
mgnify:CR=1 FL=1